MLPTTQQDSESKTASLSGPSRPELRKNASWMLAAQLMRSAAQAAYFVILARALGPDEFGLFTATVALLSVLSPFAGLGSGTVLIRAVARRPDVYSGEMGLAITTVLATSVVLLPASGIIDVGFFGSQLPLRLLVLVAIAELVCFKITELFGQAFQALEKLEFTAAIQVSIGLARLGAAILFVTSDSARDANTWALWYLGATATSTMLASTVGSMVLGPPTFSGTDRYTRRFGDGLSFSIGVAAKSVYSDADKVMLLLLRGQEAAGLYGAAHKIITLAIVPIQSLLAASYAGFFKAGQEGLDGSLKVVGRLLPVLALYGGVVGAALWLGAPVVGVVLGSDYVEAGAMVRWLAIMPLIQAVHFTLGDALTGADLQRVRSALQVSTALLNVGLNLFWITRFGWRGAIASTVSSEAVLCVSLLLAVALYNRDSSRSAPGGGDKGA